MGLPGLRGMSLSDFCDLVWLELYDDCPAMGDQQKYREMLQTIFYEGREISDRGPSGDAGKPDMSRPLPMDAMEAVKKMKERYGSPKESTD